MQVTTKSKEYIFEESLKTSHAIQSKRAHLLICRRIYNVTQR